MTNVWLFLVLQLVNVVLSTIKSFLTIKGNKWSAVIANAIYFGYYTFIIKAIGNSDTFDIFGMQVDGTITIAVITIITNFIGVYVSLTLMEKLRKDRLWLLKATVKENQCQALVNDLVKANLSFIVLHCNWNKVKPIDVYLYNKNETTICKNIIKKYDSVKYCVIETNDTVKV